MRYATDYYALNEVGRLCKMGGVIEAGTREEADKIAERLGHTIVGENLTEENLSDEMNAFCERAMKQRDEEWLKERGDDHKEQT